MKRNKINRKFRRNLAVSLMTLCSAQEMIYGMDRPKVDPNMDIPKVVGPQPGVGNIPPAPRLPQGGNIPNAPRIPQGGNIPNAPPVPGNGPPIPPPLFGPQPVNAPKENELSNETYFPLAKKFRENSLSQEESKAFDDFCKTVDKQLYDLFKRCVAEGQEKKDGIKNVQLVHQMGMLYTQREYPPETLFELEQQLKNRFTNLLNLLGPMLDTLAENISQNRINKDEVLPIRRPPAPQDKRKYPSIITPDDNVGDDDLAAAEKKPQLVANLKFGNPIPVFYSEETKKIIEERGLEGYGPGVIIPATITIPLFTGLELTEKAIPINLGCVLTYSGSKNEVDRSPVEIYCTPHAYDLTYLGTLKQKLSETMERSVNEREEWVNKKRDTYIHLDANSSRLFGTSIEDQLNPEEIDKANRRDDLRTGVTVNGRKYYMKIKTNLPKKNKNAGSGQGEKKEASKGSKADVQTELKLNFLFKDAADKVRKGANPYLESLKYKVKLLQYITGSQEIKLDDPTASKLESIITKLLESTNRNVTMIGEFNKRIQAQTKKKGPILPARIKLDLIQISKNFEVYYGDLEEADEKYFEEAKKKYQEDLAKEIAERTASLDGKLINANKEREINEKRKKLETLQKQLDASTPAKVVLRQSASETYDKIKHFQFHDEVVRTLLDQLKSNFIACAVKLKTTYTESSKKISDNTEIECTQQKKDTKITLIDKQQADKATNDLFIKHDPNDQNTPAAQVLQKLNDIQRLDGENIKVGKIKIKTVETVKGDAYAGINATTIATQILGSFDLYIYLFTQDKKELTQIEVNVPFVLLRQKINEKETYSFQYFPDTSPENINKINHAVKDLLTKRHMNTVLGKLTGSRPYEDNELELESIFDPTQRCVEAKRFTDLISTTFLPKKENKKKDQYDPFKINPGERLLSEVKRSWKGKYVPIKDIKKLKQQAEEEKTDIKSMKNYFAAPMDDNIPLPGLKELSDEQVKALYAEYPIVMDCARRVATELNNRNKIKDDLIKLFGLKDEETRWNPDKVYYDITDINKPIFKYGKLSPKEEKRMQLLKEKYNLYLKKTESDKNKQDYKPFISQIDSEWKILNSYAQDLYKNGFSNEQIQELCSEKIKNEIARVGTMDENDASIPLFNVFWDLPVNAKYDKNLVRFDPIAQKVLYGHEINRDDKNKKQSPFTKILGEVAEVEFDNAGVDAAMFKTEMEKLKKNKKEKDPSQGALPLNISDRKKLADEIEKIKKELDNIDAKNEQKAKLNALFVQEDKSSRSDGEKAFEEKAKKFDETYQNNYQDYQKDKENDEKLKKDQEEKNAAARREQDQKIIDYLKNHAQNIKNAFNADEKTLNDTKLKLERMLTLMVTSTDKERETCIAQLNAEKTVVDALLTLQKAKTDLNVDASVAMPTQEELDKLKNELDKLKNKYKYEVDKLTNEIDKLRKESTDSPVTSGGSSSPLLSKESTTTPMTSGGPSSTSLSKEDDERYNQLANQWSYLDSVNSQLTSENNSLNSKIEDLQKQLNDLKAENEELSKENKEKDSQLQNSNAQTIATGTAGLAAGAVATKMIPRFLTRTATDLAKRGITTIGKNLVQNTVSNLAAAGMGIEETGKQVAETVASDIIEKGIDTAAKSIT